MQHMVPDVGDLRMQHFCAPVLHAGQSGTFTSKPAVAPDDRHKHVAPQCLVASQPDCTSEGIPNHQPKKNWHKRGCEQLPSVGSHRSPDGFPPLGGSHCKSAELALEIGGAALLSPASLSSSTQDGKRCLIRLGLDLGLLDPGQLATEVPGTGILEHVLEDDRIGATLEDGQLVVVVVLDLPARLVGDDPAIGELHLARNANTTPCGHTALHKQLQVNGALAMQWHAWQYEHMLFHRLFALGGCALTPLALWSTCE